ncbi:MAG: hypothetical protein ABI543_04330 [Ignavibacteria bacterium]
MKTIKTEKDRLAEQDLREKREKISKELGNKSPEELKKYIAERLDQEKDKPA